MFATNPSNESEDMIPSSIFALILLLAILAVVALFAHHATDSLGLSF